jgi:hypothetical protein
MADINFGILDTQMPGRIAAIPQQQQAQQAQNAMQLMQVQQTMQQNALAKAKMEEYTRGTAEKNALRGRMTQPGFNIYDPAHQAEIMGLSPDLAPGLIKHALDVKTAESTTAKNVAQTKEAGVKTAKAQQEWNNQALRDLIPNPSDDNLRAWGQDAVIKGIYSLDESSRLVDSFLKIPLEQRADRFKQFGAPAVAPQQPRQANLAADLLIPGPNGTMVPNTALISVKKELRPLGTTVNVKLPPVENAYSTTFATEVAKDDKKLLELARNAPRVAATANRVTELLNKPDIFVGPAATVKLNMARALSVLGADETESMRNTEKLIAASGQGTLDAIKDAGLGTGQGFTTKDLVFLQGVAGGTVDLTAENLRTMSRLQYRAAELSIKKMLTRRANMPESALKGTGIDKETYDLPPRIGGPTPEAITYLKANPSTKAAFDKRYGDGEAEHTLRMGK